MCLKPVSPDCNDLSAVQGDVIHLGDKDGRHGLIQRRAVHVDGGTDGQHEPGHTFIDLQIFLQAAKGDGQRPGAEDRRTDRGRKGADVQRTGAKCLLTDIK